MGEITGGTLPTAEVQAVLASTEYSVSYPAEEAFDGSTISRETNRWVSAVNYNTTTGLPNSGDGDWYQFEFVFSLEITKVKLITGNYPKDAPKKITFYVSDTGAFAGEETNCGNTTLGAEPAANDWTAWYIAPTPTEALYFRLVINSIWPGTNGFIIVPEWVLSTTTTVITDKSLFKPLHIINPFPLLGGV